MNQSTRTIIHVNAGHVPPADYLKLLLEKMQPNAMGFAIQDGSNAEPELAIERMEDVLTLDQLVELCDNAKPWPMMLSFQRFTEPHDDKDIQPLIISDPEGKACFAITLEGDFAKFSDLASGHTEEYNFATKIIIPTIIEMIGDKEGDLDAVLKKLNGDLFNTSFLSHLGHRGVMNILPFSGDVAQLGKNELGEVYDWGSVSQKHTFGDAKQEPVKVEAPVAEKKKGWFTKGSEPVKVVASDPKGQATAGDAPRASVPEVKNKSEQARPAPAAASAKAEPTKAMKLPKWVHSNKDKQNWYMAVQGSVPENFKRGVPAIINYPEATQATNNLDIQKILVTRNGGTVKTETASVAPVVGDNKAAAAAVQNLDKHVQAEQLPIMTPKMLEAALDFVAKHLDVNAQEIADPKTMQSKENELKIPTFTEAMGLNKFDPINWSPAGIFAFFKGHPEAAALFAIEMRNNWRATVDMKDLVGSKTETKETAGAVTTTTTTGGTTKVESVAKEQPAAKKGGWFTKKVA